MAQLPLGGKALEKVDRRGHVAEALAELSELRAGPAGEKTVKGIMKLMDKGGASC